MELLTQEDLDIYENDWILIKRWFHTQEYINTVRTEAQSVMNDRWYINSIRWRQQSDLFYNHKLKHILENLWSSDLKLYEAIKRNHKIHFSYEKELVGAVPKDRKNIIRSFMSYHYPDKSKILSDHARNPEIVAMVKQILDTDSVYIKQSKYNPKRWKWSWNVLNEALWKKRSDHNFSMFWYYLDWHLNEDFVTVFNFLTPHTIENGAVYALKWSHKMRTIEPNSIAEHPQLIQENTEVAWYTAANLNVGYTKQALKKYYDTFELVHLTWNPWDIIFTHPWILHGSKENLTKSNRELTAEVYASSSNPPWNTLRPRHVNERDISPV